MSLRKLLCVLTLVAWTAIAGSGCTGPDDNGGAPPTTTPTTPSGDANTTSN